MESCSEIMDRYENADMDQALVAEELSHIFGLGYNSTTGEYQLNSRRPYCFNTTDLGNVGSYLENPSDSSDFEYVNWYMRLSRCNNKNTCKS